ncbi:DUF5819 family protein [Streptomyces chryseus]|uniref:DUF5819 family protein n=1 Tax=Streptomyces chryseus TaxID=68186 RepID=UPI0019900ADF|nr:DUF5819 family protein [Streptomyces chryseus]GGX38277.1 hypothetical protein GCM10010353_62290 [Streptomyces chryseus]
MEKTGWAVPNTMRSAGAKKDQQSDTGPAPQESHGGLVTTDRLNLGARALKAGLRTTVALCLVTTLAHVVLVFLHVAPANTVSKRYTPAINAWVYPYFEQNWRLFAPDPDSVNRQILVRTAHTGTDGSVEVSSWFDLTAVDNSAVEHNPFPSHTTQNLMRRAWTSYTETHGGDDKARTERAVMIQKYLTNIAADRVAAHTSGPFDFIQLRVVTQPIPAPGAVTSGSPGTPAETRLLPWWKVTTHGN